MIHQHNFQYDEGGSSLEKEEPVMAEFGGSVTESKARVFSTAPSNLFPQKRISPPPTSLSPPNNLPSAAPHPSTPTKISSPTPISPLLYPFNITSAPPKSTPTPLSLSLWGVL